MQKRFRISVDGRPFDVVVEEVPLDGAAVAAVPAAPAPLAPLTPLAPLAPLPPLAAHEAAAGEQVAPLAGVVDSIPVAVGQTVAVGDVVAVIEAMKMKTDVVCRTAGTVRAIPVAVGQPVEAGSVLVVVG